MADQPISSVDDLEKESYARFALNAAGLGTWNMDLQHSTIMWDERCKELYGFARKEDLVPYDQVLKYIHDDDRDHVMAAVAAALQQESGGNYDIRFRTVGGEDQKLRWLHCKGKAYFNEQGVASRFSGTAQDVTEEALAQEEQRKLRTLVDNSVDLMSLLGMDGKNTYINKAGRKILGIGETEDVSLVPISDLHTAEQLAFVEKEILPNVMQNGSWSGRFGVRNRLTGEIIPLTNHCMRIDDPATGKPIAIGAVMRDLRPELEAQEQEKKLLFLLENSSDFVSLSDVNGYVEYVNTAGRELLGLESLQAAQQHNSGYIMAGELDRLRNEINRDLFNNGRWSGEIEYRHFKTGDAVPVQATTLLIYDTPDGEPVGRATIARDLRTEKAARAALEESESRFRTFVMGSPMPIGVYVGREMKILLVNDALLAAWGRTREEVRGRTYYDVLLELESQPYFKILDDVFTTGIEYRATEDRVDLVVDGRLQIFYFSFSFTPLFDSEGKVYGVMNTATDVTGLVVARQQLKDTEENLLGAIEMGELGTWQFNPLTGITAHSERIKKWFGLTADECSLEKALQMIHVKDRERVVAAMQRAMAPGAKADYEEEYTVVNIRTGQERIIHAQGKAYFDAAGQCVQLSGTAHDITARKQIEWELEEQVQERTEELQATTEELQSTNEELSATNEELQEANLQLYQSNSELEQYAYVASHDLQEPLRKIRLYSGMLQTLHNMPEEGRPTLSKVIHSAERMSSLIKDLLEFSRLLKADKSIRQVNLNQVLNNVINDFELLIAEKEADVQVGQLPVIEAEPLQMNQLFYNLLGNALKFNRHGVLPSIRISSKRLTMQEIKQYGNLKDGLHYHEIIFADNGIGFDNRYAEQIFEVFKRLHTREEYPGSGIGLALCRKIVQNHNGMLFASSEENKGTLFYLVLPENQ
jgi:PAS domain S-box-containing protein